MNTSALEANVTLQQIASALNLNITHSVNDSEHAVTPEKLFSLYEAYRSREREHVLVYRSVAYVLGTLIILSNLTVVISSGLILKKGQQPKSTYLLLGNVSLADTIIGIAILVGALVDNTVNSNMLCLFQLGMIVCPTIVSIFSVGLIAIDRYIYIIHGLYYQRWINTTRVRIGILLIWVFGMIVCPTIVSQFSVGLIAIDRYIYIIHGLYYQRWINTTRVRIGILLIWVFGMFVGPTIVSIFSVGFIAIDRYIYIIHGLYYHRWINTTRVRIGILIIWVFGMTLSYMPFTGWRNQEFRFARCNYISVFPPELVFINSVLSIIPIVIVAVLYGKILISAIKNVKNIKSTKKHLGQISSTDDLKLRSNRGSMNTINNTHANIHGTDKFPGKTNKFNGFSKSASTSALHSIKLERVGFNEKSKSLDVLHEDIKEQKTASVGELSNVENSKLSVWYIESDFNSSSSYQNISTSLRNCSAKIQNCKAKLAAKSKQPRKARAIIVVMLTSGSFILTWMPFFITLDFYVFCESKLSNPRCLSLRGMLGGPLATLAFFNSVLNPLIYAWWHRGFQNAVKTHVKKLFSKKISFSNFIVKKPVLT